MIKAAAKAEAAIEKGFAGPGLLAFIVISKFADYLPLYRLEDIFERQGFEISRATQSVWCGDVADVVEPLYRRMAERVRQSHVVATATRSFRCSDRGRRSRHGCGST
jgi:transposase